MKIAIIGSREIEFVDIGAYLPKKCNLIISGGARGVDACAAKYAREHKIDLIELLPRYDFYGRRAPLYRNMEIVNLADEVLAFWDGKSRGTGFVIDYCKKVGKKYTVIWIGHQN